MTWHMEIFKYLKWRTASDKVLRIKAFDIAKNPEYDEYERGLASMVLRFFDKNSKGSGVNIPSEFYEQFVKKLRKPIIRTF